MISNKKEAIEFCEINSVGTLGTFDGVRPILRPHHFQMVHEDKVYFVLGANRNAVKYLTEYPNAEWMTYAFKEGEGGSIIRIDGEAAFIEEQSIKDMVFNNNYNHLITRFTGGAQSPQFKVYELQHAKISVYTPGNPKALHEFNLSTETI